MSYDIHTVEIESQHAAVVTATCTVEEVGAFLGRAFEQVLSALAREAVAVDGTGESSLSCGLDGCA